MPLLRSDVQTEAPVRVVADVENVIAGIKIDELNPCRLFLKGSDIFQPLHERVRIFVYTNFLTPSPSTRRLAVAVIAGDVPAEAN
jgi:hypothetical protein